VDDIGQVKEINKSFMRDVYCNVLKNGNDACGNRHVKNMK
jgi:hypothetical protein